MINILSQITFVHTCLCKFTDPLGLSSLDNLVLQCTRKLRNNQFGFRLPGILLFLLLLTESILKCNVSLTLEDPLRVTDFSVWDYIPRQEEYVFTGAFLKISNKYSTRL